APQGELVPIGYKSSEGTCTHSAPNLYPVERELVPIRGGNLYPMGTTLKEERNRLKSRKRESADRDGRRGGRVRRGPDDPQVAVGGIIAAATGTVFTPETPEGLGPEIASLTGEGAGHAAMYAHYMRDLDGLPGGRPWQVDEALAHLRNCANPVTRAAKDCGKLDHPGRFITSALVRACKANGLRCQPPPAASRAR